MVLIFTNKDDLTSSTAEKASLMGAVWLSLILIAVEFIGLLAGLTLRHHTNNYIHIISHGAGLLFTALFIALAWPYWIYWFIFLGCSLLSGVVEIVSIIKIIICQTRKY